MLAQKKREINTSFVKKEILFIFNIIDMFFDTKYVWYVRNRNYLTFASITVILFNLIVLFNLFHNFPLKKVSNFFGI